MTQSHKEIRELEPCPFCGDDNPCHQWTDDYVCVECMDCHASIRYGGATWGDGYCSTEQEALDVATRNWNNRSPALRELIAENDRLKERMAQDDSVAASAIEFYQKQAEALEAENAILKEEATTIYMAAQERSRERIEALEKQLSERDALLDEAYEALTVDPIDNAEDVWKAAVEKLSEFINNKQKDGE